MKLRKLLGKVRWTILSSLHRREFTLPDHEPTVSFTFDDFPHSALARGGAILSAYGNRGTYYVAMGLLGKVNELGEQFCAEDLAQLQKDGHELGSHTFDHVSCRYTTLANYQANVLKGKEAVLRVTGPQPRHHFSYPGGHVTLRAKRRIGPQLSSCRGIVPGINSSPIDLHLLRANHLYSHTIDFNAIQSLLRLNDLMRGWLIFYTHDVQDEPSAHGCKPGHFETIVRMTAQMRAKVLPVGEVLTTVPVSGERESSEPVD